LDVNERPRPSFPYSVWERKGAKLCFADLGSR
jgi:hypothetical protein